MLCLEVADLKNLILFKAIDIQPAAYRHKILLQYVLHRIYTFVLWQVRRYGLLTLRPQLLNLSGKMCEL